MCENEPVPRSTSGTIRDPCSDARIRHLIIDLVSVARTRGCREKIADSSRHGRVLGTDVLNAA